MTGRAPPSDLERDLFALPCRLGGIGIANPSKGASSEYLASLQVTKPLSDLILQQNPVYSFETLEAQLVAKSDIQRSKRQVKMANASHLKTSLPAPLQHSMSLAQEKGASSWLMALPVEEFGFALHKGAFRDALALRYGWCPTLVPSHCACGQSFSVSHALSCHMGGYPSIRHNEIRDLTADLLSEVCHCVSIEPHLQSAEGEDLRGASANTTDGARLDIAANGFWGGRFERAFFDVRVFNPHAPTNRRLQLSSCYRSHENAKKRAYEQRIREVEHGSFVPLVFVVCCFALFFLYYEVLFGFFAPLFCLVLLYACRMVSSCIVIFVVCVFIYFTIFVFILKKILILANTVRGLRGRPGLKDHVR